MQRERGRLPPVQQQLLKQRQLRSLPLVSFTRTRLDDRHDSQQRQPVPLREATTQQRQRSFALQVARQRLYSSQLIPRAAGLRGAAAEARSCCLTDSIPAARVSGGR